MDDAIKFPIKALRSTSRRDALGDPAEKQYFGKTSGVFAGIRWTFEQDRMILRMGGKEWNIVVLPNIRGTRGTRAYVKVGGKLLNNLLILNDRVGYEPN